MLSDDELREIREKNDVVPSMYSACDEYACDCHFAVPKLLLEVTRLRAENDILDKAGAALALDSAAETARLRAENARLAMDYAALKEWWDLNPSLIQHKLADLRAEVAELRAALERIVERDDQDAYLTARAALNKGV